MTAVVKNMDRAMSDMNLERVRPLRLVSLLSISPRPLKQISMVMDKFESQFEDLDVQTGYLEGTLSSDTAISAPTDQVDLLMAQVADEAGLEVQHELGKTELNKVPELATPAARVDEQQEDALAQRLRALRPATTS
jgi:charged multivesicular body protein 1